MLRASASCLLTCLLLTGCPKPPPTSDVPGSVYVKGAEERARTWIESGGAKGALPAPPPELVRYSRSTPLNAATPVKTIALVEEGSRGPGHSKTLPTFAMHDHGEQYTIVTSFDLTFDVTYEGKTGPQKVVVSLRPSADGGWAVIPPRTSLK